MNYTIKDLKERREVIRKICENYRTEMTVFGAIIVEHLYVASYRDL